MQDSMFNTEMPEVVAPSLASSAMVVSLTRSVPDLMKNDPEAARALAILKKANPVSVGVKKSLISSVAHNDLRKFSRSIYQYHIRATVPWGELGERLLPNVSLIDYQNQMKAYHVEFDAMKQQFLDDYPRAAAAAQLELGELYDESLFPSVSELAPSIKFSVDYLPISDPSSSNFYVQLGDQAAEEMRKQYGDVLDSRMDGVSQYIFEKLRVPLTNLVKRIDYDEVGKATGFHDTIVDNVAEIVELMGKCNFNNDPKIERMKISLRNALTGVTPDGLRGSVTLREKTKQDVQQIINELPTLGF
tara:strand:+ start:250 stop:1158 length:909 start_codon:yes stop_codon:yes gene_type:complete